MTRHTNLCAGLLQAGAETDPPGGLPAWLALLVRLSGARDAAVVLQTGDRTEVAARATESDPAAAPAGTDGLALGAIGTVEARLVLDLPDAAARARIEAEREALAGLFRLLVARHLETVRLAECEARLADLERFGQDWLWSSDAEGRVRIVRRDLTRLGLHRAQVLGRTFAEIADGNGLAPDAPGRAEMQAALAARAPFHGIVHTFLRPDGRHIWLRSSGAPRFDAAGNFAGYTGVSSEITDLVEQEQAARAIARRLEAVLAALPNLVLEITPEGRYTDLIGGPKDRLLVPAEDLPGRRMDELLPPKVARIARAALTEVLMRGHCEPIRYALETPAGLRWFSLTGARKEPAAPGDTATAVFVIADVTEEVERNEELARLARIVGTMTNLVAVVDMQQRIVWVNRAWEERLGWTLDEVRGKELGPLVRPPDADPDKIAAVTQAIVEGRAYRDVTVNIDRYGNRFCIDFNIQPLRDSEGTTVGYFSVETDITELRESRQRATEAAEAAERARAQLQNALEALPDGVLIWDAEERLVAVNTAYKRMYPHVADELIPGVSQDHILRVGVARGAFPSAWGREEAWIAEQWERYRTPTVDEVQRADGAWIRRLDLRTADGGRIAVRVDVTERRSREEALAEANRALTEARAALARILEAANVGAWDWCLGTSALRIEGCYLEMLGYTAADFPQIGYATFRSLVHPEDLARLDATDAETYAPPADGVERTIEQIFRMRHRNGSWAWILSRTAVAERGADGRPQRLVGVHIDITDRKRLEEAIEENRSFLNGVMEASIAAIAVLDRTGRITFANAEAERLLGLARSEVEGRRYDDPIWRPTTLQGDPVPPEGMPFRLALDSGRPVRDVRHAIERPDGTRRILSINAAPFQRDGEAGDMMVVTSFIDITDDMARADQLEQALAAAHEASRSKSAFLANMSHEIRTPLNGVLGMAEILDGLITDPRQKEMIGTIRRSGELLLNVLNDVLDMSKIEAGKMTIETIPFVPADLARSIEALHQLRAEEKGLEFEVFVNSGAAFPRLGDPLRLQQILNNLLSNAIKFTEKGYVALVVSAKAGQPLVLEVRDTGIGMTEEQIGRLFNSFEQAESGTTRRFGGTGLGMAIVRRLVDLMGGEIAVKSAPGVGTEIRVTLPLAEAREPPPAPAAVPDPALGSGTITGARLLVADDSATNRRVIDEMLKDSGALIDFAINGAEAVDLWQRRAAEGRPYDLLVLDIAMPVMDGKEALAAIRASDEGATVPAIAVTANAMAHQVAEYIMAGFDAHVPKPFRRAELIHAIQTLRAPR